jgi:hypothetical protein
MSNIFANIITEQHKKLFNSAIDSLLADNGLTTLCKLVYDIAPSKQNMLCDNCIFDPISQLSSNRYNSTGPVPFDDAVCPICLGSGYTTKQTLDNKYEEKLYLAVLSDSKYFMKINTQTTNIPDGTIQTICSIDHLQKIMNASYLIIDEPKLSSYANYSYQRAGSPNFDGFGDNRYIITMWIRK